MPKVKYNFLPYDKELVARARELRSYQTEAEKIFWNKVLKCKELSGFTFLRQKPIGHFIVDFYCSKLNLIIEIDGDVHLRQKHRDEERDNFLRQFGLKILRYTNSQVLENAESIKVSLIKEI